MLWGGEEYGNQECSCGSEFQVVEESEALIRQVLTQLRPHFRRQEAHQHTADYLRGLIATSSQSLDASMAKYTSVTGVSCSPFDPSLPYASSWPRQLFGFYGIMSGMAKLSYGLLKPRTGRPIPL
jgi:hypothetical protein